MQIKIINNKTVVCNYDPKGRGIYRWTFINKTGNKIYIGKTSVSFERRTSQHLNQVIKSVHSKAFQVAWDECERVIVDSVESIETSDNTIYLKREKEWFNLYGGIDNLVNSIYSYSDLFKKKKVCE